MNDTRSMLAQIERLREELADARAAAEIDELTQLGNRRVLNSLVASWCESETPFGVTLFDVANLKAVNDARGHPVGDKLIRDAADVIRRYSDRAVRYGGDEFVIVTDGGLKIAERVRSRVERQFGYADGTPGRSTFLTGGCAVWTRGRAIEDVLQEASADMERRKITKKRELGELISRPTN